MKCKLIYQGLRENCDNLLLFTGMPPPMGHRPGMNHMPQAPASATSGMIPRAATPAATVAAPQTAVTKPLFPSAGQVWSHFCAIFCAIILDC